MSEEMQKVLQDLSTDQNSLQEQKVAIQQLGKGTGFTPPRALLAMAICTVAIFAIKKLYDKYGADQSKNGENDDEGVQDEQKLAEENT